MHLGLFMTPDFCECQHKLNIEKIFCVFRKIDGASNFIQVCFSRLHVEIRCSTIFDQKFLLQSAKAPLERLLKIETCQEYTLAVVAYAKKTESVFHWKKTCIKTLPDTQQKFKRLKFVTGNP